MVCCDAREHPWDQFSVTARWIPTELRCLIIGESPGENVEKYFYNQSRMVAVRTIMLRELHHHGMLSAPSLDAFRNAGFLFDHGIRCLLNSETIQQEANLANQYRSSRAANAVHLDPFLAVMSPVWVMGRIARNAIADPRSEFPRDTTEISKPPNPRWMPEKPRFFVSRYLLHASRVEVAQIFERHRAAHCDACLSTE